MQQNFLDTREAPVKWFAAQDAQMRNTVNKTIWPDSVHQRVQRMLAVLDMLYAGKIYEAYGRRRVSIKIDRPVVRDRRWLAVMEKDWAELGVVKTVTPQGILYKVV